MSAADSAICRCGHKGISHGATGECGIDRDTRNASTGYVGDPCPCKSFTAPSRHAARVPDSSPWSLDTISQADARALRTEDALRAMQRPTRLAQEDLTTLSTARDRIARVAAVRAIQRREARRRALPWLALGAILGLGILGLLLTPILPGIG